MKKYNYQKGKRGEDIAKQYLTDKGFEFIEANFENDLGEIDLIMVDKDTLVFVEVKLKIGDKLGIPEEMINKRKLYRVKRVAESYLVMKPKMKKQFQKYRIDAVCIVMKNIAEVETIRHYENLY